MTMFKTKEQIEKVSREYAETYPRDYKQTAFFSHRDGATQMQKDIKEELKHLCTYDSTAIGKQAECYLKIMPTLVDIIDKHGIGVFLRGIVYRTYTQAQQDLKEACSEGFDPERYHAWAKDRLYSFYGGCYEKEVRTYIPLIWQAAKLSSMKELQELKEKNANQEGTIKRDLRWREVKIKELQEKDEEIKRLKKLICKCDTSVGFICESCHEQINWAKYQEAVNDIQKLLDVRDRLRSKLVSMRAFEIVDSVFNPIRIKYGIDKKEG